MNLHKFHSSRDGFHLPGGLCLPCIRSLCLTEIPGTRSAVSLGITLSHRKFCQNAHFQTSESRLDVHTHFWFFHFCRLNRELFLGHVISTRRRREPHGTVETRVRAREEQGRLRRPVASLLCEVGRPPAAARDPDTSEVASITLGIVRGAKDST